MGDGVCRRGDWQVGTCSGSSWNSGISLFGSILLTKCCISPSEMACVPSVVGWSPSEFGSALGGCSGWACGSTLIMPGVLFLVWCKWGQGAVRSLYGAVGSVDDGLSSAYGWMLSVSFLNIDTNFCCASIWRPGCWMFSPWSH